MRKVRLTLLEGKKGGREGGRKWPFCLEKNSRVIVSWRKFRNLNQGTIKHLIYFKYL